MKKEYIEPAIMIMAAEGTTMMAGSYGFTEGRPTSEPEITEGGSDNQFSKPYDAWEE